MNKYYALTALLSSAWFVVLLVPSLSREWLLKGEPWYIHIICMVLAGLLVARMFLRFILSADGFWDRLVRAVVLPFCGAFFYLLLVVGWWWIRQFMFGGLTNLHDSLSAIYMGLLGTALSFYVVIPYGILCQCVLEWAARDLEMDLDTE